MRTPKSPQVVRLEGRVRRLREALRKMREVPGIHTTDQKSGATYSELIDHALTGRLRWSAGRR